MAITMNWNKMKKIKGTKIRLIRGFPEIAEFNRSISSRKPNNCRLVN